MSLKKLFENSFLLFQQLVKQYFFTFLSFLAGLTFFLHFIIYNSTSGEWIHALVQWTTQSNIFAFLIVVCYCLFKKSFLFKNNLLILVAINILFVAAVGFWLVLFPVAFAGLSYYLFQPKPNGSQHESLFLTNFFYIWNHGVTQICYFMFMLEAFRNNKNKNDSLVPINFKKIILVTLGYATFYLLVFGAILTTTTNIFPVYGIFTNFNPNKFVIDDQQREIRLFNLQLLVTSIVGLYLIVSLITFFNWRISLQLNNKTSKELLKNIV
ncbi:hypothetical protein MCAV_00370 [[Mycoplasma] cavipharyngis]|uniref:hypothetical protein n=1 Tax=[Mycoplasma] cavipharyngis TaxID=92757 RepID=UPI0037045DBD